MRWWRRIRGRAAPWLLLVIAAMAPAGIAGAASKDAAVPVIDAEAIVGRIADGLVQGRNDTLARLRSLGFGPALDETGQSPRGLGALSARSLIESLYRRAEAASAGEGKRLLAILHADVASRSAALATDPAFKPFAGFAPADLDPRQRPVQFAPPSALPSPAVPLSPAVEQAVAKLAQVYAGPGVASARGLMLRHLRKQGFGAAQFERLVLESATAQEAVARVVLAGTPPPAPEQALRDTFIDLMATSAALAMDAALWSIVERLSAELPPERSAYAANESRLPSRQQQARATGESSPVASSRGAFEIPRTEVDAAEQRFSEWRGSGPRQERAAAERRRHESSVRSGNSTYRPPPPRPRPRKGVVIGDSLEVRLDGMPRAALWVANRKDDRFGRLFVVLADAPDTPRRLVASRVMFADSFYAAAELALRRPRDAGALTSARQVLVTLDRPTARVLALESALTRSTDELGKWLDHQHGELSLLSVVHKRLQGSIAERVDSPSARAYLARDRALGLLDDHEDARAIELQLADERWMDLAGTRLRRPDATLGLVLHPALVGREVAWSLARADFLPLNQRRFADESVLLGASAREAAALPAITLERAAGWFFIDRPARVELEPGALAWRLAVRPQEPSPRGSADSPGPDSLLQSRVQRRIRPGDPDTAHQVPPTARDPSAEKALDAWLAWLPRRHHDFMRIDDLAHSLALLRWIGSHGLRTEALDVNGPGKALPMPRFYRWSTGPDVAR